MEKLALAVQNRKRLHKIAYKSASMADRPGMFAPTSGFSGIADSTEPCKCCGPTLVAMATTFALGAESNRLPLVCLSVRRITEKVVNGF